MSGLTDTILRRAFALDVVRSTGADAPLTRAAIAARHDPMPALGRDLTNEGLLPSGAARSDWLEHRQRVFADHFTASVSYRPRPFSGRVLLILAKGRADHDQVVADWQRVALGGLTVVTLSADHYSIVSDQSAADLADALTTWNSGARD